MESTIHNCWPHPCNFKTFGVVLILADFGYPVYALWFIAPKTLLNYLAFQSFDIERT